VKTPAAGPIACTLKSLPTSKNLTSNPIPDDSSAIEHPDVGDAAPTNAQADIVESRLTATVRRSHADAEPHLTTTDTSKNVVA
jgi:hypothetical protein